MNKERNNNGNIYLLEDFLVEKARGQPSNNCPTQYFQLQIIVKYLCEALLYLNCPLGITELIAGHSEPRGPGA